MISTSTYYDDKMQAITRPQLFAEVEYRQTTVGANDLASVSATGYNTSVSQTVQIVNGDTDESKKFISCEWNSFLLDGSAEIIPDAIADRGQMGIYSASVCGSDMTLATPLVITITLSSAVTSAGLSIIFDSARRGRATSFTLTAYNGAMVVKTVTASASNYYYVLKAPISNYNKIVIEVDAWSVPLSYAKVEQVLFGILRIHDNSDLTEFSLSAEISPINKTSASNQFKFAAANFDGEMSYGNEDGNFAYVTQRQEVRPRIGFASEKIKLGVFYLSAWNIDDYKAEYEAQDALSLADVSFPDGTYSATLHSIAQTALTAAGITDYNMDSSLTGISVSNVSVSGKTCRDVLSCIAVAARLCLYVDVYGVTTIGALPTASTGYEITWYVSDRPTVELDNMVKSITVNYGTDLSVSATLNSTGDEISISGNPFITTQAIANAVLSWLTAYYNRRVNLANNWRQNPTLQLADVISVQTKYGNQTTQVIKQDLSFSGGGMTGKTTSKVVQA